MARTFTISSPNKVFFPDAGLTKGDLIAYYEQIAPVMLPHVRGRIVTMARYPDGIAGKRFFQKSVPEHFPDWIHTLEVKKEGGTLEQLTIENAETLAYLANQGCIEIHVWPSRADRPDRPDRMIFDLDPSTDDFGLVRRAARAVRELLDSVGLPSFVMTSGSSGLHVVTPLDRKSSFDEVRDFAAAAARLIAAREDQSFTVEQRKHKRHGRVFIDYLRNAYAQHAVAPYAVRAKPGAPVATPLDWAEVADSKLHPRKYTVENLGRRLAQKGDPWKDIAASAASLGTLRRRLEERLSSVEAGSSDPPGAGAVRGERRV
jgi:bifunctional non-homologous end joining protein LigD